MGIGMGMGMGMVKNLACAWGIDHCQGMGTVKTWPLALHSTAWSVHRPWAWGWGWSMDVDETGSLDMVVSIGLGAMPMRHAHGAWRCS